jgi:hypothetical protein
VLWRPEEHEPLSARPWDESLALEEVRAIVADAEAAGRSGIWPGHPRDELGDDERDLCSIYLGGAGVLLGLWRLGCSIDVARVIAKLVDRYRVAPDFGEQAHPPSMWMGETGLLVVADLVGSPAADRERLSELIRANREHPTWELMWGSPGTMLAALACGLDREWAESATLLWAGWDEATDVWTQHMYGQVTQYLGPVHGFAGCVHALRGYVPDDALRARATRLLERTAGREGGLVNWPPRDEPISVAGPTIRVQWCHGAPGIVATLGDLMPLELATGAGELIWRAGPLRKGSGLCHGTAGNGYAFLKLHALTGDPLWLERARRFAMHAIEQVERARAQFGHGRYTLWTGDIGVALYVRACVDGNPAVPTIDGF